MLLALHASGACRIAPKSLAGIGVIFMLHRVREDDGAEFAPNRILEITPGFLEETIGTVRDLGYTCMPLDEAVTRLEAGEHGERFAVFTLDDGYRDNLTDALPVFERNGVPFTVYLTTGLPDGHAEIWWVALERAIASARRTTPGTRFTGRCARSPNARCAPRCAASPPSMASTWAR
jgi:peptidoglycan/xylan/chitin deacetylase (PgdA/CDA1 family)